MLHNRLILNWGDVFRIVTRSSVWGSVLLNIWSIHQIKMQNICLQNKQTNKIFRTDNSKKDSSIMAKKIKFQKHLHRQRYWAKTNQKKFNNCESRFLPLSLKKKKSVKQKEDERNSTTEPFLFFFLIVTFISSLSKFPFQTESTWDAKLADEVGWGYGYS